MSRYAVSISACLLAAPAVASAAPVDVRANDAAYATEVQVEHVFLALAGHTHGFTDEEEWAIAEAVHQAGRLENVDPFLILSVMRVESSLKRGQRSWVGALGLMQVMPRTGEAFAEKAGVPWEGVSTLWDPVNNIRIGTTYLAYLLKRFKGDVTLALTSYCHGPTRVRRLLNAQGKLDDERLRYSRKVTRYWRQYRVTPIDRLPVS